MKTAVEWLVEEMPDISGYIPTGIALQFTAKLEQAKEMEKQQIIDFADSYVYNCVVPDENMVIPTLMDVESYYNKLGYPKFLTQIYSIINN